MAKCVCPPVKKTTKPTKAKPKTKPSKGTPKTTGGTKKPPPKKTLKAVAKKDIQKKGKRHGHPANMFILYFLDMYRQYGGNMYCVAKECGRRWREGVVTDADKAKYKRAYCAMCKNCKSCQASKKK